MTTLQLLTWQVGTVRITRILEVEVAGLSFLVPDAIPQNLLAIPWLHPPFITAGGEAVACIQAFLVETGLRTILIDTGVGVPRQAEIPTRIERAAPFLEELGAAGVSPEDVDTVLYTHLHFDHLGWSSRDVDGRRVPTFPNARYVVSRTEWEHWSILRDRSTQALLTDTIRPVAVAGQLDLVASDSEVAPGIRLEPTPGHSLGHVSVHVTSQGERAIVTGDVIHHPAQMAHPAWWTTFDADVELARATRLRFLERHAGSDTLIIGSHFAGSVAGRIVRDAAAFRFVE
jgi:glyoxylase-like metal-dependent hydrolase (beta-lactamase superfamily II)